MACRTGFTLVELMIALAIMSLLSAMAVPNFYHVLVKSKEAATKGNLGTLRSALAIYYADNEGTLPGDDLTSMSPKYLKEVPQKYTPYYHPDGNAVSFGPIGNMAAARGDWFYVSEGPGFGSIYINCIHTDLKGVIWSTY